MLLQTPAATQRARHAPLLPTYSRQIRGEMRTDIGNGRVIPINRATERPPGAGVAPKAAPASSWRGQDDRRPEGPAIDAMSAAAVAEHDRIAAELSDSVIHRLYAAGLILHSAADWLRAPTASQATVATAGHIDNAIRLLDESIGEVRATVYRMRDRDRAGGTNLPYRLDAVVTDMTAVLGFAPSVRMTAALADAVADGIDDDLVIALRELLANIVLHARARTVAVTIEIETGYLTLEVVDDGVGIGAGTRQGGLAELQNRAEHHGGSLQACAGERPGTRIRWSVPI